MTVTAVVIARTREGAGQVLTALLAQDRRPERVLLVDGAIDGLGETGDLLAPIDEAGIDVLQTALGARQGLRRHLPSMIDSLPRAAVGRDLVWVLPSRVRPHPRALRRLAAALGPGVGMASPKVVDEDRPREIVRFGLQVTRSGRLVPDPVAGTVDQGQYDTDVDAIAAPLEGLLVDRAVYERLRGHDPSLGDLGGDLDLGWRSQRAGGRVVLVPSAAVAVRPKAVERRPGVVHRRQARRTALARTNVLAAPFVALWVAVASLVSGLGLLILKRPGMATEELAGIPAALDPRRLRSRWRGRAQKQVSRSDLDSLFVPRAAARRRIVDDARGPARIDEGVAARALEVERGGGWFVHPLLWLVLAATALSAWAARSITGELRHRPDSGLVGGELLGGRATGGQLWDAWLMAWHGQGWGHGGELSPAHVVLAAPSLLFQWIPGPGSVHSPAGVVLTLLVMLALPVAAAVAWSTARTFTERPWLRAAAALAWVTSAPAVLAVGEGRIGALLVLVLLPRVATGLVRTAGRHASFSDAVRTALWAALLGTVAPVVGVGVVLVGLGLLVVGDAGQRIRGIALVVVPLLLAGPWLLTLRAEPYRLLAGWGLTDAPVDLAPWRLALGQLPSAPPTTWPAAVVLGLGALALLAPRRGAWGAAVVALLGLVWAVAAPHLVIGHRPAGGPDAGSAITPWAGTGQLVLIGAALVAILLAADGLLPLHVRGSGRRMLLWVPALVLPVAAVGSGVLVGLHSYGDDLDTWRDPRPLVAVAAAEGSGAARTLVLEPGDDRLRYRLVGSEPGPLVRNLPHPREPVHSEEAVAGAVAQLFGEGEGDRSPAEVFAEQGISHVVVVDPSAAQRRLVDASGGLGRLGSSAGAITWAVRSELTDGHVPTRARVVSDDASEPVEGTGAHADTDGPVSVPEGERLVVAESLRWSDTAQVRADGTLLEMSTRSAIPTYPLPSGTDEVSIDVGVGHPIWKIIQGVALLLALYLALPTERRPDLAAEERDEEQP